MNNSWVVTRGSGSAATLEAFPRPAGIIVVIGTFPVAAEPPSRANEAAGEAKTTKNAKATFAQVFDIRKIHYDSLEPENACN